MVGKIAGSAFIVAATSKIGFDAANKFENRRRCLQSLSSGIWLLKNDIDFSLSTLSVTLKRVSTLVDKNISALFLKVSKYIEGGKTAYESFDIALNELKDILALNNDDYNTLLDFAKNLGSGDIESEVRNFDKTLERLRICETLAVENINKYSKMCKTLGITAGILCVIILM